MNDIEVGKYARTDKGNIFIYANVINEKGEKEDYILVKVKSKEYVNSWTWEKLWLHDENIINHSKNIIDLIEVGDYVNGRKIERVNDYGEHKRADFNLDFDDCDAVYNDDIKSILTKEQFKEGEYVVDDQNR